MSEDYYFKTNTLLKNLVGKDLINDDNIAIIELVKNSYDAKSDDVTVRFTEISNNWRSNPESQLIISDHGCGMDLSDLVDKWLNIAYSEKSQIDPTGGDFVAGNKGVGRFSCDRLGETLDILTRIEGGELLHLHIEWKDFEKEGDKDLTIQQIPLQINPISEEEARKLSNLAEFPLHGTSLTISSLRELWDKEKLRKLKTSLERFLNPNQLFIRNKFRIFLSIPDHLKTEKSKPYPEKIDGEIENQIFNKLKFNSTYIETTISKESKTIEISLFHEGEKVFNLIETNTKYPLLENVYVIIYFLNPYKKAYFKKQTGVRLLDFGSIFLFLNGFRVAPFGDRGNDWLKLDIRKTQGTARYLGNRDIVGRIEVIGPESKFKPISSREGLKDTPAVHQLQQSFFLDILRKLEKFVVNGLDWDSVPAELRNKLSRNEGLDWKNTAEQYVETKERKQQRIVQSLMTLIGSSPDSIQSFWFNPALLEEVYENRRDDVKSILDSIDGFDSNKIASDFKNELKKIKKLVDQKEQESLEAKQTSAKLRRKVVHRDRKIDKLTNVSETYRAQTLFLQQVTNINVTDLMAFHHQINLDSIKASNHISRAIKAVTNGKKAKQVVDILEKALFANKKISATAQFASKANFKSAARKEPTDIPAFFEQYLTIVAKDFIASGIKLEVINNVKEQFEIQVSRIELSILADNLISNSTKAFAPKLLVTINKHSENTVTISFKDNGRGLSPELPSIESMFDLGITTRSGGSGLGLHHSKNIVEKMSGIIKAIPITGQETGMEIIIEVTR